MHVDSHRFALLIFAVHFTVSSHYHDLFSVSVQKETHKISF